MAQASRIKHTGGPQSNHLRYIRSIYVDKITINSIDCGILKALSNRSKHAIVCEQIVGMEKSNNIARGQANTFV